MSRTVLVKNFLNGVLVTLQDLNAPYDRWPEKELVYYTNLGQRAIASYLPQAGSRVDTIKLAAGTRQDLTKVLAADIKPGDGSTAADTYGISFLDITRNMGANGLTPGRAPRKIDKASQDMADPLWHTRIGGVVKSFMSDGRTPLVFYVTPGVSPSTPVWVELPWVAEPARVPDGGAPGAEIYLSAGASTALLGIADEWEEDLRNYVLGMAFLKGSKNEQNVAKAAVHVAAFTSSINAKSQALNGSNPALKNLPFADSAST